MTFELLIKNVLSTVVRQFADICLFSTAQYVCPVASIEGEDFIAANQSGWCKVYTLHPVLAANRDKRGLALDGKIKHEETNLASSTILDNSTSKDNLGIIVSYKVKVKLYLAFGAGDIAVELPFILTHPLPSPPSNAQHSSTTNGTTSHRNGGATKAQPISGRHGSASLGDASVGDGTAGAEVIGTSLPTVDHNLIQLEDEPEPVAVQLDDDVIFDDFARMRLQAHAARSQPENPPANLFQQQPPMQPQTAFPSNNPVILTTSALATNFQPSAPAPATLVSLQHQQIFTNIDDPSAGPASNNSNSNIGNMIGNNGHQIPAPVPSHSQPYSAYQPTIAANNGHHPFFGLQPSPHIQPQPLHPFSDSSA